MAYPRGRTLTEVIIAVVFVCFLIGFVAVLCIGNYFRAKQAMERQKQRRLQRLASTSTGSTLNNKPSIINNNNGIDSSPRSHYSSGASTLDGTGTVDEHVHLLSGPPTLPRRRNNNDDTANANNNDLLLFDSTNSQQPTTTTSVRPKVMRV